MQSDAQGRGRGQGGEEFNIACNIVGLELTITMEKWAKSCITGQCQYSVRNWEEKLRE